MSTPYAKRRRLNEAAKTLQKPFKSPFRTPLRPGFGSDPPSSDPPEINTSYATASAAAVAASSKAPDEDPRETQPTAPTSASSTPGSLNTQKLRPVSLKPNTGTSRISTRKGPSKPALTREIMQLRNEIQILIQAQALATSNKDDDLVVLIDRWRVASRAAAEELFATTRDKVNRMGGVGAWKAREKEHKERQTQWDREELNAERERLEEARESGEIGHEAYDRWAEQMDESGPVQKEEETFQAADDDSFTMDMMLKTLNIDLDLIGYNKEAQRWEG